MKPCPICGAVLGAPALGSPDRLHGTPGWFGVAVCARCGAGVTQPDVPVEALGAYYPDEYGPYVRPRNPLLAAISFGIRAWQGVLARRSAPLSALRGTSPGRVLDVGAGRGDLAAMLRARGWRATA